MTFCIITDVLSTKKGDMPHKLNIDMIITTNIQSIKSVNLQDVCQYTNTPRNTKKKEKIIKVKANRVGIEYDPLISKHTTCRQKLSQYAC